MENIQEIVKLIGAIVGILLGILGFIWDVIKDWDKAAKYVDRLKGSLGRIFKPSVAWVLLLIMGTVNVYLIVGTPPISQRDTFVQHNLAKQALVPVVQYSYDFEEIKQVPVAIKAIGFTKGLEISNDQYFAGKQSLKLDIDLPAWTTPDDFASIYLEGDTKRIDAISTYFYIPRSNFTTDGKFSVHFAAVKPTGSIAWSGSQSVEVGKWSFLFWGTRYAHADENLCYDTNQDSLCDEPAISYWREWNKPDIKGFYIRVVRNGENYSGPVYIDNIVSYVVE